MNSFNLFRLDENTARKPKYISENEFQFVYDCIKGKYNSIVSEADKDKLRDKILSYLSVETTFEENVNYGNCEAAKAYIKKLKKDNPTIEDLSKVQLFCSTVPKFMNEWIQKIFDNIVEEKNYLLRKKFISLHIDIFIDFFTNRESADIVKKTPKSSLYDSLVVLYDSKFDKKNDLISFEFDDKTKNFIFKLFKIYLSLNQKDQPKSKTYGHNDCRTLDTTIRKLLCAITHSRKSPEYFKFERGFEHSNQFKPFKGGVAYNISTIDDLNAAGQIEKYSDEKEQSAAQQKVYVGYINLLKILLASSSIKDLYKNCNKENENYTNCEVNNSKIKEEVREIFNNTVFLQIISNQKMTKGDIMVTNPVSLCRNYEENVLVKDDILELKYFTIQDIVNKDYTVHITRILEPDFKKIYSNIDSNSFIENNGGDSNFFIKFLKELISIIIEISQENIERDFEQIKNTFSNLKGLIIAGPKFIKNENWKLFIDRGTGKQRGIGVAINVELPLDFATKARDISYIKSKNLFCFKN